MYQNKEYVLFVECLSYEFLIFLCLQRVHLPRFTINVSAKKIFKFEIII